jgi:hypothetical protein
VKVGAVLATTALAAGVPLAAHEARVLIHPATAAAAATAKPAKVRRAGALTPPAISNASFTLFRPGAQGVLSGRVLSNRRVRAVKSPHLSSVAGRGQAVEAVGKPAPVSAQPSSHSGPGDDGALTQSETLTEDSGSHKGTAGGDGSSGDHKSGGSGHGGGSDQPSSDEGGAPPPGSGSDDTSDSSGDSGSSGNGKGSGGDSSGGGDQPSSVDDHSGSGGGSGKDATSGGDSASGSGDAPADEEG